MESGTKVKLLPTVTKLDLENVGIRPEVIERLLEGETFEVHSCWFDNSKGKDVAYIRGFNCECIILVIFLQSLSIDDLAIPESMSHLACKLLKKKEDEVINDIVRIVKAADGDVEMFKKNLTNYLRIVEIKYESDVQGNSSP